MAVENEDNHTYLVVVNEEAQYSIWREGRPLPAGWRTEGKQGSKKECLEHIAATWTDMRPLSVRSSEDTAAPPPPPAEAREPTTKNDLVARLESEQPIVFVGRPESNRAELDAQLRRGRVFVRFERTGTELGVKLKAPSSTGDGTSETVPIEGELLLNYNRVRFVGHVEVATMRGVGRLEFLGAVDG